MNNNLLIGQAVGKLVCHICKDCTGMNMAMPYDAKRICEVGLYISHDLKLKGQQSKSGVERNSTKNVMATCW